MKMKKRILVLKNNFDISRRDITNKKNETKNTPFLKMNTQKLLGNKYDFAQSTNFGTQKKSFSLSLLFLLTKKKLFREKKPKLSSYYSW